MFLHGLAVFQILTVVGMALPMTIRTNDIHTLGVGVSGDKVCSTGPEQLVFNICFMVCLVESTIIYLTREEAVNSPFILCFPTYYWSPGGYQES